MTSDFNFGCNAPKRPRGPPRSRWPTALSKSVVGVATMIVVIAAAHVPVADAAPVDLVVVDVVQVANGYRASKLHGDTVSNPQNQKIGTLDDLIVGKDRVLFAIVEVGGFLGIGSHLSPCPTAHYRSTKTAAVSYCRARRSSRSKVFQSSNIDRATREYVI